MTTLSNPNTAAVTPIMLAACPRVTYTYRAAGQETICMASPSLGVQQMIGFNAANGDIIGVDDILELTTAKTDLSDVAKYITSAVSGGSTTLYFDPTGHGLQGPAFAVLQGVVTTVAQLVADGGMQYIPDAIAVTAQFNTPLAFRPSGLETVAVLAPVPGIGPEQLNGFDPTRSDVLDLTAVLNPTTAAANLSNVANYITATTVGGNTILSVDATGAGKPGLAFAQLDGVSVTVSELVADNALIYSPTATTMQVAAGSTFVFRAAGDEMVNIAPATRAAAAPILQGFSLAAGDSLFVRQILPEANATVTAANIANYFSATQSNGSTSLWFSPTGSGQGGNLVATLQNTSVSLAALVSAGALNLGAPIVPTPPGPRLMCAGNTAALITYRSQGNETVSLQPPSQGVQQLAGFNAATGDVVELNSVLQYTPAQANLSDVANYVTSAISGAGTTLYFDPTGHGLKGSSIAVLQGVDTTVAQLVASGGMQYTPAAMWVWTQFDTPLTLRPSGMETVFVQPPVPGGSPEQISGFNPASGDVLDLRQVLNPTTALPDLSNVGNYIKAVTTGGSTILSVDTTGRGLPGAAFAQLQGVSLSLSQLLADGALAFTPSSTNPAALAGQTFQFRPEGNETAELPGAGVATLQGLSLTNGDALGVGNLFASHNLNPDMAHLANYISAVGSGGSTALYFDPAGSGHGGGSEFALLQNTSVSFATLSAHNVFSLN